MSGVEGFGVMIRRALPALALLLALAGGGTPAPAAAGAEAALDEHVLGETCNLSVPVDQVSGDGAPLPGALPFGTETCRGARPGAQVVVGWAGCTLAFAFEDSAGNRYLTTAGHCVVGGGTERTWAVGAGPVARTRDDSGAWRRVGTVVYAHLDGPFDFAVIRADDPSSVDPEMCHFGGPTAMYEGVAFHPEPIHHHGFGSFNRDHLPARSGVTAGTFTEYTVRVATMASPGDSGSSVITADGRALGVLVRSLLLTNAGGGYAELSRLDTQLARAEAALGVDLTLLTAPLRTAAAVLS